jgi:hypothetical protein
LSFPGCAWQVFDDVKLQKYLPSVPPTILTDQETAACAQKDAQDNPSTENRAADAAGFSGREPGLVNLEDLVGKKAGRPKGSKSGLPHGVNGLFGGIPQELSTPQAVSRRNLAFKPGKHKLPVDLRGPAEPIVARPAGTPIRERWWEKQLQGPDGKFHTHTEKVKMKSRMENGGAESGGEARLKKRKAVTAARVSDLAGVSDGGMLLLESGERVGDEPNEVRLKEQRWAKESGKEWVGGPDEPGPKKKRVLEVGLDEGGSGGGETERGGGRARRARKSTAGGYADFEWWEAGTSDSSEGEGEAGEVRNWAVLGDDDINDGHDGLCKVCQETGTLLLCEGCPSVYHFRCAGLAEMPLEDKWWCPECISAQTLVNGQREGASGSGLGGLVGGALVESNKPVAGSPGRPRVTGEETAAAVLILLGDND